MSAPLRGKQVFIEIFDEEDNISSAFHSLVSSLGGTLVTTMKKTVHFLVWRRGRQWVWQKACKYRIAAVTPLWLEACERDKALPPASSFRPPEPNFELLVKRPRKAFTSPGRNLPASKRHRPVPSATKHIDSSPRSAARAKIEFSDTSASGDEGSERKVFLCGPSTSEIDADLRLLSAKTTLKPASADLALVSDPEEVQGIAVALSCKLPIVDSEWLAASCESQTWLAVDKYQLTEYRLVPDLFAGLRFAVEVELMRQGLVRRLLTAGNGTIVTHPREGDYFVTESSPPRLPSHIKVVDSTWVARCLVTGRIGKERETSCEKSPPTYSGKP